MAILAVVHSSQWLGHLLPVVLYVGPDVFLPIASALAAIGGVLLMFWQRVVSIVGRLFGRSKTDASAAKAPSDVRPD